MRTYALPRNLPQHLIDAVFIAPNGEVAWPPLLVAEVTRWLGNHGYAVLGTELWVIKPDGSICSLPLGRSGRPEVHGNTVDRHKDEPWPAFVRRSAAETTAYFENFDSAEILELGDMRFQITWVTAEDFAELLAGGKQSVQTKRAL